MVSTWGIRGHFRASRGYERAAETAVGGRGETADCRTDVGSRRIGSTGRADAWCECQPSVSVAQAVSAKVAGSGEHRDGEFTSGSCDGSAGPRNGAVERRAETPEAYLRNVLSRISDHPINHIEELLPWNVAASIQVEMQHVA